MRRGVRNMLGAGAAALCLGGLLSACGNDGGDGYVATGAAGAAPERAPGKTVGPSGDVKLVPLDKGGDGARTGKGDGASEAPAGGESSSSAASRGAGGSEGKSPAADESSGSADAPASGDGSSSGDGPGPGSPSAPGTDGPGTGGSGSDGPGTQDPKPEPPSGPAALSVGDPERKPADKRWCEKVTVAFRNTGGSPVRSGTVTFETHIIGALGVDWATVESTVKLPVPIGPGQKKEKTWPVCVDAWRVPLGMHVETQDVAVKWR
ncbi:hypothetical protein [Streptomyces atriruber]|uniref:hypothetical protein n=1 Tax=Streptomyces atriruber TaxID=545121 RepID=UPI0006E21D51|nr:hypothetical protein [Streptomyces atriruber]